MSGHGSSMVEAGRKDQNTVRRIARGILELEFGEALGQSNFSAEAVVEQAARGVPEILGEVRHERALRDALRRALIRTRFLQATRFLGAVSLVLSLVAATLGPPLLGPIAAGIALATLLGIFVEGIADDRSDPAAFTGPDEPTASLREKCQAAEREYDAALFRAVRLWLSEWANVVLGDIYEAELPELNPTGLAEVDDSEREIPTEASAELEHLIECMPASSIGIAGPRGAGKTTVLRHVTGSEREADKAESPFGIVVDAPVEYEARDFILHLFGRLCERVVGLRRVAELRGWNRPRGLGRRFRPSHSLYPPGLGPLLLLLGSTLYLAILTNNIKLKLDAVEPYALGAMLLGAALLYGTLVTDMPSVRRWVQGLPFVAVRSSPTATAEACLRQIWFQQSFSVKWSGSLTLPMVASVGAERSAQLAENQLSLPDIVALYKEFVGLLASQGQVRIGIDELDKMDDERARRFLNEIKAIFRSSNCFYLVSVSEDAMSYFERRGLPFREVFDSSFDEVVRVGYLPYLVSGRMLRKRVVGLPVQFACLCHILGGGLPRDVIRVAREVCDFQAGMGLEEVVTRICRRQLERKRGAAWVAAQRLRDPKHTVLLGEWLRGLEAAGPAPEAMLDRCRSFAVDFVERLGEPPREDTERLREHWEALSIALELVSFMYFVATLDEFMPTLGTEAETTAALGAGAIEGLAEARQAFARGPGEAWEAISDLRGETLGEEPLALPRLWPRSDEHGGSRLRARD